MLEIKNLYVYVDSKNILEDINLKFEDGKNYCIIGKNGSGKSSLLMSIMSNNKYNIKKGKIILDGEIISDIPTYKIAKKGIYVAFQHIPEIHGVKVFEFLQTAYNNFVDKPLGFVKFKNLIVPLLEKLNLDSEFLWRDLNCGFSGGERRKLELLQVILFKPKYIFLDEIDSGLDINSLKEVGNFIREIDDKTNGFIFVTHLFDILNYIDIDKVIYLSEGKVKKIGDKKIIKSIKESGFEDK